MPRAGKGMKPWKAGSRRGKKNGRTEASERGGKYDFEIFLF